MQELIALLKRRVVDSIVYHNATVWIEESYKEDRKAEAWTKAFIFGNRKFVHKFKRGIYAQT